MKGVRQATRSVYVAHVTNPAMLAQQCSYKQVGGQHAPDHPQKTPVQHTPPHTHRANVHKPSSSSSSSSCIQHTLTHTVQTCINHHHRHHHHHHHRANNMPSPILSSTIVGRPRRHAGARAQGHASKGAHGQRRVGMPYRQPQLHY